MYYQLSMSWNTPYFKEYFTSEKIWNKGRDLSKTVNQTRKKQRVCDVVTAASLARLPQTNKNPICCSPFNYCIKSLLPQLNRISKITDVTFLVISP